MAVVLKTIARNPLSILKRNFEYGNQSIATAKKSFPRHNWHNLQDQRLFFEQLASKLNLKSPQDLVKIPKKTITEFGGKRLIDEYYNGSIFQAIKAIYPELRWTKDQEILYTKSEKSPNKFFSDITQQRIYFDSFKQSKGLRNQEDWYQLKASEFEETEMEDFLEKYYGGFLYRALSQLYPEYYWKPWRFHSSIQFPLNFWKEIDNQRAFFNELAIKMNIDVINNWRNWSSVKISDVIENGGAEIINFYKSVDYLQSSGHIINILMLVYPEHPWDISAASSANNSNFSSWKDLQFLKEYFGKLEQTLGLKSHKDWYFIRKSDVELYGGKYTTELLNYYFGSFIRPLILLYPIDKYDWDFNKFEEIKNHRQVFLNIVSNISKITGKNFDSWETWYQLTYDLIRDHGGSNLNHIYNSSPLQIMYNLFPEHNFEIWKFNRVPKFFFDDLNRVKETVDQMSKYFNIQQLDDWYSITHVQLNRIGMKAFIDRNGGLIPLLSKLYPEHPWKLEGGTHGYYSIYNKAQNTLFKYLRESLDLNYDIHVSYLHPKLIYSQTGKLMELDIYIPALNLAFEYQGKHHYTDKESEHFQISDEFKLLVQIKDEEKREACKSENITLIAIPYWWDQSKSTLLDLLSQTRPDLDSLFNPKK